MIGRLHPDELSDLKDWSEGHHEGGWVPVVKLIAYVEGRLAVDRKEELARASIKPSPLADQIADAVIDGLQITEGEPEDMRRLETSVVSDLVAQAIEENKANCTSTSHAWEDLVTQIIIDETSPWIIRNGNPTQRAKAILSASVKIVAILEGRDS